MEHRNYIESIIWKIERKVDRKYNLTKLRGTSIIIKCNQSFRSFHDINRQGWSRERILLADGTNMTVCSYVTPKSNYDMHNAVLYTQH